MPQSPGPALRRIPSVTLLLSDPAGAETLSSYPRPLVIKLLREILEQKRRELLAGGEPQLSPVALWQDLALRIKAKTAYHLRRVVNGTGVVIHTNLGRSLLARSAAAQVDLVARAYSNLEFDLEQGRRGSRYSHVEELLIELTGAEAALVVNNNAAAVLLALDTLARGREVVVSRGQLVEIGGSFRVPDVMSRSGALLHEVGTTNKTHMRDYENALNERTALLLKVHTSNFRILGFTSEVPLEDLVALGKTRGLPVMEDLGSGSLLDLSPYGLEKEPTVAEAVRTGADLVTFSGDKLLGGPQAGILVGKKTVIQNVRANPLNRALRTDKLTLAALEATLHLYRRPDQALKEIPTLNLLTTPPAVLRRRAGKLRQYLKRANLSSVALEVVPTASQVGGGALPLSSLPSYALALLPLRGTVNDLEIHLRGRNVPIIGRIEKDRFLLDLRTILETDFPAIRESLSAWAETRRNP